MALTKITSTNIGANAVTSSALSNTALTTALGYTPANKAGDTFTNNINIGYDGYPSLKYKNAAGTDKAEIYVGTSAGDLNIIVNSQAAIAIDSSARIRMQYQPAFQVRLSGNQTISGNTRTKINFNTVDYQNGSDYNTSLQRFTAPVTGWYQFNSWAYGYTVSNNELALYKNGSIYLRSQWAAGSSINNVNSHLSVVTKLTAGDYVEMWCALNPTGDLYHSSDRPTVWSGILIG